MLLTVVDIEPYFLLNLTIIYFSWYKIINLHPPKKKLEVMTHDI